MYDHHIDELTSKLVEAGVQVPDTVTIESTEIIRNTLKEYFSDRVAIVWQKEDVISREEHLKLTLTDDERMNVLHLLLSDHDACFGINWDSIDYAIERTVKERS